MKKFIFLFLMFSSQLVWSQDIKLSCKIAMVKSYSNGVSSTVQFNEVFTITEYPSKKFIIPTSDNFSSVSTVVFPDVLSINDFSDSSKWDISVNQKGIVEGSVINTSIRIDRNTGQIWYSRTFPAENGITISEDGIGNCEKINMKKKKF